MSLCSACLILYSIYSTVTSIVVMLCISKDPSILSEWNHLCVKLQGAYGALTTPIPKVESRASIAIRLLLFTQSNPPTPVRD